jgi:hypothetical protein
VFPLHRDVAANGPLRGALIAVLGVPAAAERNRNLGEAERLSSDRVDPLTTVEVEGGVATGDYATVLRTPGPGPSSLRFVPPAGDARHHAAAVPRDRRHALFALGPLPLSASGCCVRGRALAASAGEQGFVF